MTMLIMKILSKGPSQDHDQDDQDDHNDYNDHDVQDDHNYPDDHDDDSGVRGDII